MPARYCKSDDVDVDVFDGELILVHVDTRRVLILNGAAHGLWDALDLVSDREGLIELVAEALPDSPPAEIAAAVDGVLSDLVTNGFLLVEDGAGQEECAGAGAAQI